MRPVFFFVTVFIIAFIEPAKANVEFDKEKILESLSIAEKMVEATNLVRPFGVVIRYDGKSEVIDAAKPPYESYSPHINPLAGITNLLSTIRARAKTGEYRALVVIYSNFQNFGTGNPKGEIVVSIDHAEGYNKSIIKPYKIKRGKVSYGKIKEQEGAFSFFVKENSYTGPISRLEKNEGVASNPASGKRAPRVGPGNWVYLQETDRNTQRESFNLLKNNFMVSCGIDFHPKIAMRIPITLTQNSSWKLRYKLESRDSVDIGEMQTSLMGAIMIDDRQLIDELIVGMKAEGSILFSATNSSYDDVGIFDYSLNLDGANEAFSWLEQNCQL